jgi:diguanylate cyclase (GGDEF)-like protein
MTRQPDSTSPIGRTILVVDDDPDFLEAARILLQREGHTVLCAADGPEALALLRDQPVDLMLLDYFMPGMSGEEVVTQLRQFNPYVQVIVQTSYPSELPPRELMRRLDVQGYHDKREGMDRMLLWAEVGLRAARTMQLLSHSRQGLRSILQATPELHKIQPLEDLFQNILEQAADLVGVADSFLALLPEGGFLRPMSLETDSLVAIMDEEHELVVRAGLGRFSDRGVLDQYLELPKVKLVLEALQRGEARIVETTTVVPLRVGELTLGVIYLDQAVVQEQDIELLRLFANQAAVAIQNAQLYQMATLDPLTGVCVRRFFEQQILRELQTAFRSRQPLSLLMVDVQGMRRINDTAGHLVGDQALATLGRVLRQTTRGSDVVGRYGGDEFALILPQATAEAAERVSQRILNALQGSLVPGLDGRLSLHSSIGLTMLRPHAFAAADIPRPIPRVYFRNMAQSLIQRASEALSQAQQVGGSEVRLGPVAEWQPFEG